MRSIFDSPFPICLWSGPHYALIYNDPYRRILAAKHPAALGQPGSSVWAEIWDELQPQFDGVRAGGAPVSFEDAPFVMARLDGGGTETAWFNYSLSALRDEDGSVAAVLNITPETTARVVLERRLTEEQTALAMSEERLRLAVDNADVGLWDVDVVEDRLSWSTRTKAMFGISAEVPVSMDDFYAGLHPDDREATTAAYLGAADPDRRALYDVEYRTIGKEDGIERWVAAKGRGVFDATGRCLRVTGTTLEITTRKAAEIRRSVLVDLTQAIRDLNEPADIAHATAEILGRTLGSSRVGYAAIDHDAETLHVDRDWTAPGVETLAGVLSLRDYGSFVDNLKRGEFIVIDDVRADPRTAGPAADALEGKGSRAFVNMPVLEQGRLVAVFFVNHGRKRNWSEGDLTLIRDVADRTRNAVERARGEHALRESEAQLRELNETLEAQVAARSAERDRLWNLSQDMLARADYTGMMSAVSPAWTRVLGWTERELLSRGYATFMHPDDEPPTLKAIGRMAETGRPTRFENRIGTSDGDWKSIEWTVAPERDGVNFIAVGRDLSAAKAREAELATAQEALRQSQKMEAVGQLTGGLAHDFNNLLAGISGSLELMQTRMSQGRLNDVDRYMAAAQGAAKRAAALTHRLLAFSRRQTLDPRPTDANRLVTGMQELVQRTVGPQITIEVVGASGAWPALVDPSQLENALLNLCINARDAMPDGGQITIETANKWLDERAGRQQDVPEGQYLTLSVTDTGTGMPPEVIERVFEPFFTTKPLGEGTGLGLSMIYGFAQQSGGQVRIYSEVGKGTTVSIYLPRHDGELDAEEIHAAPAALPRSEQGETVLVVDDEPTVRMLVTDILEDLGYTAIEAADSAAGLKVLQSDVRIDLLVTDVGLPGGMNGRQMADAARVSRPDLLVLFITGYAENAVLGNGHLAPGMAVMTKPFAVEAMAARIRSMIEASRVEPLRRRRV
ncbi:hybrid sensor histidine kinase/response regulator [Methylobacterium haplocladii]|uniref:histidine kinase n=1 Tax=Methylobacterium haplocladii TaxID=1176176 RepID=A0A512IN10_9HYPH|nr:hybrid sensor histidine kinase/response regulator [Methylobacterium haplocladii]GLS58393.1 hybrid sensor histidine kinase/response regulator [Methylobacterium haplocladii]